MGEFSSLKLPFLYMLCPDIQALCINQIYKPSVSNVCTYRYLLCVIGAATLCLLCPYLHSYTPIHHPYTSIVFYVITWL